MKKNLNIFIIFFLFIIGLFSLSFFFLNGKIGKNYFILIILFFIISLIFYFFYQKIQKRNFYIKIKEKKKNIIEKARTKGMVGQSSKFLINKMIKNIDFSKDLIIVQFGSGKGVFQKEILKKMSEDSKIYVFEINKNLDKFGKKFNDKRYIYINDSAENLENYVKEDVDVIISTLPFGSLPKNLLKKIIGISKNILKEDGLFLQYQYFLQNKKDIEKIFDKKAKLSFTPINLPPAFVYKINK